MNGLKAEKVHCREKGRKTMRTLVKYRGGKSRELSEFRQYIPNEYESFRRERRCHYGYAGIEEPDLPRRKSRYRV